MPFPNLPAPCSCLTLLVAASSTDGFDPDSCTDVRLHDSIIDTGDDGISIKSGNVSAEEMAARAGRSIRGTKQTVQRPAKDIHIYRTKVLSRNFCLGSGPRFPCRRLPAPLY